MFTLKNRLLMQREFVHESFYVKLHRCGLFFVCRFCVILKPRRIHLQSSSLIHDLDGSSANRVEAVELHVYAV